MTKKGLTILAILTAFGVSDAASQRRNIRMVTPTRKVEFTALGGYQFGGTLDGFDGRYSIKPGFGFTGLVDITLRPGAQLELMYNRQETVERFQSFGSGIREDLWDVTVQYFQVGGLGYVKKGVAEPFGVFTLGLTSYSPAPSNVSGETRFSGTLGAGAKVFPSQRFGLRFEGRLMMTFLSSSVGLGCGTGGCSGGLWGWGVAQGVFSGGATLAF